MDTTTPKSTSPVAAPVPARGRFAGFIVWFSLFASVIGLLSAFHDLIPMLTRLSLLTKALFAAYHIARDWLWHEIRIVFGWVHIHIPEIPVTWKDALVITSFVLAALNFESVRRHRISLFSSFWTNLGIFAGNVFFNRSVNPNIGLFHGSTVFEGTLGDWFVSFSILMAFLLEGFLLHLFLNALGIATVLPFVPASWSGVADSLAFGAALFAYFVLTTTFEDDLEARVLGKPLLWIRAILCFPMAFVIFPQIALLNGRRAVVFAIGLIVFFVSMNFAFLRWIDPALQHPPLWLQQLINADPATLPKSQS